MTEHSIIAPAAKHHIISCNLWLETQNFYWLKPRLLVETGSTNFPSQMAKLSHMAVLLEVCPNHAVKTLTPINLAHRWPDQHWQILISTHSNVITSPTMFMAKINLHIYNGYQSKWPQAPQIYAEKINSLPPTLIEPPDLYPAPEWLCLTSYPPKITPTPEFSPAICELLWTKTPYVPDPSYMPPEPSPLPTDPILMFFSCPELDG